MKKKNRRRKAYISCKGVRKADYEKALLMRYNIIFTGDPADADFFIAPFDKDGLNERQERELEKAESMGLECCLVSSEALLKNEIKDPLDINREEMLYKEGKYERESRGSFSKDDEHGLELG